MRRAEIYFKDEAAGLLTQFDDGSFEFRYNQDWENNTNKQPISLSLPKSGNPFYSSYLFPFFFNMLPEGSNKFVVCQENRIDKDDYMGLLLTTAKSDTIGAVTVKEINAI